MYGFCKKPLKISQKTKRFFLDCFFTLLLRGRITLIGL
jgi:hypothetical protein